MVLQLPQLFYGEHQEVRKRARTLLKSVWKSGGWDKTHPSLEPVAADAPILLPNASVYARMPPKGPYWRLYCVGQTIEETWLDPTASPKSQGTFLSGLQFDWFTIGLLGDWTVPSRFDRDVYVRIAEAMLKVIRLYEDFVPRFSTGMSATGDMRNYDRGFHNFWFWSILRIFAFLGHSFPAPPARDLPQTADAVFEFLHQSGCIRQTENGFEVAA